AEPEGDLGGRSLERLSEEPAEQHRDHLSLRWEGIGRSASGTTSASCKQLYTTSSTSAARNHPDRCRMCCGIFSPDRIGNWEFPCLFVPPLLWFCCCPSPPECAATTGPSSAVPPGRASIEASACRRNGAARATSPGNRRFPARAGRRPSFTTDAST